jgi:excinuclease ABC subunit A
MDKPVYDSIRGLAPTISIEQKAASSNPRSTGGDHHEIHDYLRVLWARVGRLTCHNCGRPVSQQSSQQIVHEIADLPRARSSWSWPRWSRSARASTATFWSRPARAASPARA